MIRRLYNLASLTAAAALLFGSAACSKLCQQMQTQAFRSLVDAQWRLVQTTDPDVGAGLTNFDFLIMTLNRDNTGQINRVVSNSQYEQPVLTLAWAPNPAAGLVRIQYSSGNGTPGDQGTFDYSYHLSTQLEMRSRGYYYRWVAYKGVVNPDTECSF